MEKSDLTNIGSKIRRERRTKGFSQADLSKSLGISPSYLNLLESGKRTITVPLLIKIVNELGLSLQDLTLESNKRLLSDVMEVLSNEIFEDLDITNQETNDFISSNPNIAKALLSLNDTYKSLRDDMQDRLEVLDIESSLKEKKSSRLPVEIVSDFLQENSNYFDSIEINAERIRNKIYFEEGHRTIAHPFNPVYLLPLVEIVKGRKTKHNFIKKSEIFYRSIGMQPLIIKKEVEGYLSDRLQESMWRESLHIINENLASTDDLDKAIVHGPGLRWSLMGTFLTFHLAGGKHGMKHMLNQFGPTLKLPWTKLKAPKLTRKLKNRIIKGTKNQCKSKSIKELTTIRDNFLIDLLKIKNKYKI